MSPQTLWRRVLNERRAVLLPLVVAFVVNAGALALGVVPLRQAVKNAERSAIDARLRLGAARKADQDAKASRAGKDRADVEMKKFYSEVLPRDFQGATTLTNFWLQRIAAESGLRFEAGSFQHQAVQDSGLVKFTAKVDLTGEYANIRRFLYEVETAEQFVTIESVQLSQSAAGQTGGQLAISLEISTYYIDEKMDRSRGAQ